MLNLVDSLLFEKPIIYKENHTILSNIKMNDLIKNKNVDNIELVSFRDILSNNSKFRFDKLECDDFIISKNLLSFLKEDCGYFIIKRIFDCRIQYFFNSNNEINLKRVFELFSKKFTYLREGEDGYVYYGKNGKSKIKYGKLIKYIQKFYYNSDDYVNENIEEFVDMYKIRFSMKDFRVSILNGKSILHGYNPQYFETNTGMLGNSCMNCRYSYLKLYTNNPNKIYMLVITNNAGKILSRCLLWRLKKQNNFFLDRVYALDNHIRQAVIDLAKCENWAYRDVDGYICNNYKYTNDGKIKDGRNNINNVSIKLSFKGVKKYPYIDTFYRQRRWSRKLTSKQIKLSYQYNTTRGDRTKILK